MLNVEDAGLKILEALYVIGIYPVYAGYIRKAIIVIFANPLPQPFRIQDGRVPELTNYCAGFRVGREEREVNTEETE
jgi:hypothetical protein